MGGCKTRCPPPQLFGRVPSVPPAAQSPWFQAPEVRLCRTTQGRTMTTFRLRGMWRCWKFDGRCWACSCGSSKLLLTSFLIWLELAPNSSQDNRRQCYGNKVKVFRNSRYHLSISIVFQRVQRTSPSRKTLNTEHWRVARRRHSSG